MRRLIVLALLSVSGCLPGTAAPDEPVRCTDAFNAARCNAIADRVSQELGIRYQEIGELLILPNPTPRVVDGKVILEVRSGGPSVRLLVHRVDGTSAAFEIQCGGIASAWDPACMERPALRESSVTMGGYGDVPCREDGICATPHPPIHPDAAAAASPITIERLDVPIHEVGHYKILVGTGSLPNGILSEASFRLVDDWPDGISIDGGVVTLDVRSLEPDGRSFDNYYGHGWREGVERVEAALVFDVTRFDPGAVLSVADIVVR